ncbi:MAG: NosD domain-containing protein [Patescibacteria group bacterium]
MTWSQSLSGDGGTIFLSNSKDDLSKETDAGETVIDKVAWGQGKENYLRGETKEFTPAPSAGQSIERKANLNSDAESMVKGGADEFLGNGWDTDDNSADFVLQATPNPQNSASMAEPVPTPVHNITNGLDYPSIQWAIDSASAGDKIWVDSGTYYENVNINKQLTLEGIDTGGGKPVVDAKGKGSAITLSAGNSVIDGFVVTSSFSNELNVGINIISGNNTIKNNKAELNCIGIKLFSARNNNISANEIVNNMNYGIYFSFSDGNVLSDNIMRNQLIGPGVYFYSSANNKIYHNNFVGNSSLTAPTAGFNNYQASVYSGVGNIFDNDYSSGGNYWSDYKGVDLYGGIIQDQSGSDGIGDTPYIILGGEEGVQDRYPLMQ